MLRMGYFLLFFTKEDVNLTMTLFKWLSGSLSLLICLLSPTNNFPPYFISPSPPPHLLFEVKKALTGRCFTETVFSILSYVGSSTFSPIPRRVRIFQWQDKNRLLPPLHIMENRERGGEKKGISLQEYRERKGNESSAFTGNQKPSGHWEEEGSTSTGEAPLIIP